LKFGAFQGRHNSLRNLPFMQKQLPLITFLQIIQDSRRFETRFSKHRPGLHLCLVAFVQFVKQNGTRMALESTEPGCS